ncbi:MAG: DAK2 domain-containing protein [Peptococcaceae bacterium]|nr:DAK2 domain-containing protein [Peptococcaceae bacterium]
MGKFYTFIDGFMFKKMMVMGQRYLDARKKEVDALNVFPVPDGDTGINMSLTFGSAVKYTEKVTGNSIADVASAASTGSLFGARGNSGVILSQIMRGMAKGLENIDQANAGQVAEALQAGVESAYKAVMRPVEGTILTVSTELAKGAVALAQTGEIDVLSILRAGYHRGQNGLKKTPDLLPALKQAGVVDAGGFGLLLIIEGWIACLENKSLPESPLPEEGSWPDRSQEEKIPESRVLVGIQEVADLEYPYCTEFLVQGSNLDVERIRGDLIDRGDCLLVVGTPQVVKIHVHTANPGGVLEYAVGLGSLHEVQIHNMLSQNESAAHDRKSERDVKTFQTTAIEAAAAAAEAKAVEAKAVEVKAKSEAVAKKKYGMAAVAVGDGIAEIFSGLGADRVIHGGQTMNPSAQDIVEAVQTIHADNVFVFPNNKNIIMAARQAGDLLKDQRIIVIPSHSIAQGIAGMLEFNPSLEAEPNEKAMIKSLTKVGSGEVTYAVRDSQADGFSIKEGEVLGLVEGNIAAHGESVVQVAQQVLEGLKWRERSLVTFFYGIETQAADVDALKAWLAAEDDTIEVEVYEGKQPLYYFVMGVE